jgi:hypothetical protein
MDSRGHRSRPRSSRCDSGRTRTCYPRLRRPVLYPDELRSQTTHSLTRAARWRERCARMELGQGPTRTNPERLRATARASGPTFNEGLPQALAAGLDDVPRLAALGPASRGGETVRLGVLGLPAEMAERLNVVAQELGLPVTEVIRRALRFVTRQGRCLAGQAIAWALHSQRMNRALKPRLGSLGRGLPGRALRLASNPSPASTGSPSRGGI